MKRPILPLYRPLNYQVSNESMLVIDHLLLVVIQLCHVLLVAGETYAIVLQQLAVLGRLLALSAQRIESRVEITFLIKLVHALIMQTRMVLITIDTADEFGPIHGIVFDQLLHFRVSHPLFEANETEGTGGLPTLCGLSSPLHCLNENRIILGDDSPSMILDIFEHPVECSRG